MADRRWRDGSDSEHGDDDAVDRAPWPGKHSSTSTQRDDGAGLWPGKRSVTGSMTMPKPRNPHAAGQAVQRKSRGAPATGDVQATARQGLEGSGSPLPHLDQIQQSFGRHDVSRVQAHTGDAAATASGQLGARAYAHGDAVAFAGPPDLHTAAHEAAHVVQQRGGVQLKGLDGGASDPYEQHADAVADAVVRGQSAEGLLGSMAGSGGGSASAVQRKPGDKQQQGLPQQSADNLMPEGTNFQVLADGSVLVRNDWLVNAKDASMAGARVTAPAEVAEILAEMKAKGVLSWMDSAEIPRLSTILGIDDIQPKEKFSRVGVAISVYYLIGPPPGRDVIVSRFDDPKVGHGLLAVVRDSILLSGPVPANGKIVNLSPAVRDELLTAAEQQTKLKMDPGVRNFAINGAFEWNATLDPNAKGTYVPITENSCDALFGKAKWEAYVKKPSTGATGVVSGKPGESEQKPQWLPKGDLALDPLQPQYMTGSSVNVSINWDFSVHADAAFILLPGHCDYTWSVKKNGKVVDGSSFAVFSDNRSTSLKLDGDPGKYEITLVATSDHFLTKDHRYTRSVSLNAINEAAFDKQEFDKEALGNNGPFTRDPTTGQLQLKPKQQALTTEQEIQTLAMTRGAIDALVTQGKLTESDHDVLVQQLDKQKAELEEIAKKTKGGTPYIVTGTFVGREDSSSTKLQLLMHMMQRAVSGGDGTYSILLHDTTFGDPTQHPGSGSGPVTADTNAAFQKLETAALEDMADHFHAHNDYPNGTVHLAAQMLTGSTVWQTTRDTDNGRKTAKKILGGVAMVGGVALLIVPGADVASAPLIVLGDALMVGTAVATVGSVALEIEDRMAKEGELKFDRRLALDVLQVVAVALPFGTMTRVFAGLKPIAKTGMLFTMLGIDAAQGFIITADVRDQLRLIDANAAEQIATATSEEQKQKIYADRDRKIATVLGAAMVNGAFILISLGGGIKRIAASMHTGVIIQIREPVATIKEQGRATMEETLKKGWFEHENEKVALSDEERTFLEQEVEALKTAEGGGGNKDNGGGNNKDNGGGGGKEPNGKGSKKPEPDAQTAADLKKYADAEQQQADTTAVQNGTATKEQRERLAEDLRRQVPDIALVDAVRTGNAKTVISVVTPGGGEFGIKRMNDELISYQFNSNRLIPGRNKIIKDAFEAQTFKVVDQNYKTTTFVTDKAPAATTPGMDAAAKQIDRQMKPLLEQVIDEATQHFRADIAKRTAPDPEIALGQDRIKKMADLRKQIETTKDFHFDFQMGAAELKGGKDATYADVLGSEMNATKAAIMARDKSFKPEVGAAGGRGMVFSDAEFVTFAKETVGIKDKLIADNATLPYHGDRLAVFEAGNLNRDILRAVRMGSYHETLSETDKRTLSAVEQYFKRVNSLDYIKHFTGDEVGAQGQKVASTDALVKQLEGDKPISKEAADQIQSTLTQGTPQADAANEAQFYAKAASLHERVVLNADIKDMGLDLFAGYESSIDKVGRDPDANVNSVSQHASDGIVEFKRNAANAFKKFYTEELLPKAKELARQQKRQDVLDALEKEPEPLVLLGGDEITVSLNKAFEELGLLPEAVAKLTSPEVANARVAVTKTDNGPGAAGHVAAMKAGQGGQDFLKKDFEPLARDLRTKADSLPKKHAANARALADRIDRMYTEERSGKTQLMNPDGTVVDPSRLKADARAFLDYKAKAQPPTMPPGNGNNTPPNSIPPNDDDDDEGP